MTWINLFLELIYRNRDVRIVHVTGIIGGYRLLKEDSTTTVLSANQGAEKKVFLSKLADCSRANFAMAVDTRGPSPKGHHLCNAGAGAVVGVIAATFVCSLDVIKTMFEVHGLPQLANANIKADRVITGSRDQIFQKDGLRGMYRGLSSLPYSACFASKLSNARNEKRCGDI